MSDIVSNKVSNKVSNDTQDNDDDGFLYLLANPEKKTSKLQSTTYTIDDEIIRLLNLKMSETNFNLIIDKSKFEKIINYIKILK
jgi:hypothetical protein